MREILFRGKRLDNGEWVEGAFSPERSPYPATIFHGKFNEYGDYVDPATVGQFTGLLDKCGKRVFEGDNLSVIRHGQKYGCVVRDIRDMPSVMFGSSVTNITVVGNIHDNPGMPIGGGPG